MRIGSLFASGAFAAALVVGACSSEESKTNLDPAGPPDVLQVFVTNLVPDGVGGFAAELDLAFGKHSEACDVAAQPPGALAPDQFCSPVGNGTVGAAQLAGNKIRIIVSELLDGSTVEQFQCACANCNGGPAAARDPIECKDDPTTPLNEEGRWKDDDNNGVPDNAVLLSDCEDVAAGDNDYNKCLNGVDDDADGVIDEHTGILTITCGATVIVPNREDGFYNPSGNQQVPVAAGLAEGLGPAIVLELTETLPASTLCTIDLTSTVKDRMSGAALPIVDHGGNAIAAPATPITFTTGTM